MQLETLADLSGELQNALNEEWHAEGSLADARRTMDALEAAIVAHAYDTGAIKGKNADERKRAEAILLHNPRPFLDEPWVLFLWDHMRGVMSQREYIRQIGRSQRKEVETRISLIKAWLYSRHVPAETSGSEGDKLDIDISPGIDAYGPAV